jgi:dihydroorotate dehydrogenase (fumarate)
MDLSTTYLGFELPHPIIPGASPLSGDLDTVRRLEDAGAPAIVLHSLFEEQLLAEALSAFPAADEERGLISEMQALFPRTDLYALDPDDYLEHLQRVKSTVAVPVIASLNGLTAGGWIDSARRLEQAGADALELNLYFVATRTHQDGDAVEDRHEQIVAAVRRSVQVPVAVKLTPFYTALPNFAGKLAAAGVDGLVLFNRFYAPSVDIEQRRRVAPLPLSSPADLPLRLYWLSIMEGQLPLSLAANGGIHTAGDVVQAVMAGAHAVQVVSALLEHGPEYLGVVRDGVARWLEEHGCDSLARIRGCMSLGDQAHLLADERAAYIRLLQSRRFRPKPPGLSD